MMIVGVLQHCFNEQIFCQCMKSHFSAPFAEMTRVQTQHIIYLPVLNKDLDQTSAAFVLHHTIDTPLLLVSEHLTNQFF